MAITKITDPSAVPVTVADYEAQNIQLDRLMGDSVQPYPVSGSNVVKGALFNIGGDMFYCGADTAISGTPSDYVKLVVSGSTAAASFVSSLSGVAWNSAYNGYYNGVDLYVFDEVKAVLAGAISGYKTAMGAMWMLNAGQGLKTTDSPTFASVNTGHGANELYEMNQNVKTTDSPTFAGVKTDNVVLKTKVISFGPWNMDSTNAFSVTHGLLDHTKIRGLDTIIISNGGSSYIPLLYLGTGASGDISGGYGAITSTQVLLIRQAGRLFDNSSFNAATGYLTITYEA